MKIKDFEIITTKLNMIHFPDCIKDRFILINVGSNLDILLPKDNVQKIILNYNIKSPDLPLHIMWECRISLTYDEKIEEKITQEEFLTYSEVIDVIDKNILTISTLANMDLPPFSKGLGE